MRPPSTQIRLLGNPVVAAMGLLCAGVIGIAAWQEGPDGFWPGLAAFVFACLIGGANQQVAAYQRWKREWDAIADPGMQARQERNRKRGLVFGALLCGAVLVAIVAPTKQGPPLMAGGLLLGGLWLVVAIIRRIRHRLARRIPVEARRARRGRRARPAAGADAPRRLRRAARPLPARAGASGSLRWAPPIAAWPVAPKLSRRPGRAGRSHRPRRLARPAAAPTTPLRNRQPLPVTGHELAIY